MSEYTPSTEDVREQWADSPVGRIAFDRWLARVKADAFDEGDNARRVFVESDDYSTWPMDYRGQPINPYRGESA